MSVPQLRFKQFHDEWLEISLGDVSKNVMYGMNAAAIPFDGLNKYIRITDIDEETRAFIPSPLTSPDGKIENKYKLKNGDIVFARTGASVGKSYLYKEKDGNLLFAGFLVKFSITDAHPYFVYTNTLTESYKGWVTVMSMRSGQPGVNAEELKEYKFLTPGVPEQTKIANFLTIVDEKISQLTRKHDLLTQYKKGVMQQIFSQALRFKDEDGREFPEWEEKKIGKISNIIIAGGTPSTLKIEYWKGNIRWMNSGELNLKKVYEVENRITELGLSKSSTKMIPPKCVLIGLAGQGKTRGTIAMNMIELCTNQSIASIFPNPKVFNEEFLYQNLDARYDEIRGLSTGDGGRGGLNLQIIKSITIPFPCIQEQAKIANFLTTIDDKITATKAQLAAVKQYKQGLLQQMFV